MSERHAKVTSRRARRLDEMSRLGRACAHGEANERHDARQKSRAAISIALASANREEDRQRHPGRRSARRVFMIGDEPRFQSERNDQAMMLEAIRLRRLLRSMRDLRRSGCRSQLMPPSAMARRVRQDLLVMLQVARRSPRRSASWTRGAFDDGRCTGRGGRCGGSAGCGDQPGRSLVSSSRGAVGRAVVDEDRLPIDPGQRDAQLAAAAVRHCQPRCADRNDDAKLKRVLAAATPWRQQPMASQLAIPPMKQRSSPAISAVDGKCRAKPRSASVPALSARTVRPWSLTSAKPPDTRCSRAARPACGRRRGRRPAASS